MPLTREQCLAWQAMNIGPLWVLRDGPDPLEPPGTRPASRAAAAPPAPVAAPRPAPRPAPVRPAGPPVSGGWRQAPAPVYRKAAVPAGTAQAPAVRQDPGIVALAPKADWKELEGLVKKCQACPMAKTRRNTVFADGAPGCPLMVVGEAPGRDEDFEGKPFVGKSGQLLTSIFSAIGMERGKDVLICNVLKCRPPNNRDPRPEEAEACSVFLERQIELANPRVLLLLGRHAVMSLLGTTASIGGLRGRVHLVEACGRSIPAVVSYHPSYLLRSPLEKEKSWHDFLLLKETLEKAAG